MDIDQRLEKLAERHEAMMRTIEATAQMHQKNEEAHQRNEVQLARLMERANTLLRITDAQRQRTRGLEDGDR